MVTLLVPFLSGVTILPFLNPSTKDSLGLYLLSGFLVIYNRTAICAAIISSWAKWKSPVVFNDSIEQDFSHRSLSRISHGCSVSGSCQGGSRDDSGHFYWTTLGKHQGFFFFLLLIPNQFSWIISTQSLPSSFLLSFQNIGTYINITCESFGSSLDIFTSVFLNCSPPL